jgi:hypothetical protein
MPSLYESTVFEGASGCLEAFMAFAIVISHDEIDTRYLTNTKMTELARQSYFN